MKPRFVYAVLFIQTYLSVCTTERNKYDDTPDVTGKSKIELSPLLVSAGLNDIIIISAPIINKNTVYYLGMPNGDNIKLEMNTSVITTEYKEISRINDANNDTLKYYEGNVKTIIPASNKYEIFKVNNQNACYAATNCYVEKKRFFEAYEFTIGPLTEDDHGNWVLSAYCRGNDGEWMELFQVITIEIIEPLPTHPTNIHLIPGETFEPRFLHPIINLESCEIRAPVSTFDRFYDRDKKYLDSCGFRIPNVTKEDQGTWKILGVGKIVYEGDVYLEINDFFP